MGIQITDCNKSGIEAKTNGKAVLLTKKSSGNTLALHKDDVEKVVEKVKELRW